MVTAVTVYRPPPEPEPAPLPEPAPEPAPAPEPQGLQCDPPRSQLEAEQCAELEGNAARVRPPEPEPPPTRHLNDCPDHAAGHPGEDYLNCQ